MFNMERKCINFILLCKWFGNWLPLIIFSFYACKLSTILMISHFQTWKNYRNVLVFFVAADFPYHCHCFYRILIPKVIVSNIWFGLYLLETRTAVKLRSQTWCFRSQIHCKGKITVTKVFNLHLIFWFIFKFNFLEINIKYYS